MIFFSREKSYMWSDFSIDIHDIFEFSLFLSITFSFSSFWWIRILSKSSKWFRNVYKNQSLPTITHRSAIWSNFVLALVFLWHSISFAPLIISLFPCTEWYFPLESGSRGRITQNVYKKFMVKLKMYGVEHQIINTSSRNIPTLNIATSSLMSLESTKLHLLETESKWDGVL